jgi:hypothetical protein
VAVNKVSLIYLDTNVYARTFDDQARPSISEESNAFLEIIRAVKANRLVLLWSDILEFEVESILDEDKRTKVEAYLELCTQHIGSSEEVLNLGKQIQNNCRVRARDALHVASAIWEKPVTSSPAIKKLQKWSRQGAIAVSLKHIVRHIFRP